MVYGLWAMISKLFRRSGDGQRDAAQGVVEFALVLPVFLLLIYGVIEFGRLLFFYSAITSSSREAARYGAAVGQNGGGIPYYRDCTGIIAAAKRVGSIAGIQDGDVTIQYDGGPFTSPYASCSSTATVDLGDRIVVKVQTNFQPILPLVNLPPIPINSTTARTIIRSVQIVGTPPDTPTPLPPTATPTPTNTLTPTLTPTNTLTPTPTNTNTPTITPTPDCAAVYITAIWASGDDIWMTVRNDNSTPIFLTASTLTWSLLESDGSADSNAEVDWFRFNGNTYYGGNDPSSPTSANPSPPGVQMNANSTASWHMDFDNAASPLVLSSQAVVNLTFDASCAVSGTLFPVEVEIVNPAVSGQQVGTQEETRFEAEGWDTGVGTSNGDGVDRILFEIYDPFGNLIHSQSESALAYCAFGGNGPCATMPDSMWNNLSGGPHTIRARTDANSGVWSPWEEKIFEVPGPLMTPTFTPSPTNTQTPTITPTPTNTLTPTITLTPSITPTPSDTPTPTNTPTMTPTPTPTPDCSQYVASGLTIDPDAKKISLTLFNIHPTDPVDVANIFVTWSGTSQLTTATLGASQIWSGVENPPSALISGFTGDTQIGASSSKPLVLQFASGTLVPSAGTQVVVGFDNSCAVSSTFN